MPYSKNSRLPCSKTQRRCAIASGFLPLTARSRPRKHRASVRFSSSTASARRAASSISPRRYLIAGHGQAASSSLPADSPRTRVCGRLIAGGTRGQAAQDHGVRDVFSFPPLDLDDLAEAANRVTLVREHHRQCAPVVSPAIARVDPDRFGRVGDRVFVFALPAPGVAATAKRIDVLGVEPDCLGQVRDRLVVLLPGTPGFAAELINERFFGVQPNRFAVILDRLVVVALRVPGEASLFVGACVPGLKPDRLGVVGDRLVVFSLFVLGMPSVVVRFGIRWFQPDRRGVVGDGLVVFVLLEPAAAPVVV